MSDEPIVNPMIRELQAKLGHGGYLCATPPTERQAELRFRVPWKESYIFLGTFKEGHLTISFTIFSRRDSEYSKPAFQFHNTFDMHDPGFDPDRALDDLVRMIKLFKEGYKKDKEGSKIDRKPIADIWLALGRTDGGPFKRH